MVIPFLVLGATVLLSWTMNRSLTFVLRNAFVLTTLIPSEATQIRWICGSLAFCWGCFLARRLFFEVRDLDGDDEVFHIKEYGMGQV